jgi:hypothetical protein
MMLLVPAVGLFWVSSLSRAPIELISVQLLLSPEPFGMKLIGKLVAFLLVFPLLFLRI